MIAFFLALFLGCGEEPAAPVESPAPTAAPTVPTAPAAPEGPRVPSTTDKRFAARHILVAFKGGVSSLSGGSRTREEAMARIEEAKKKIEAGADFAEIAKAYSDDPTGPRGGDLGGFDQGTMVKPFEDALRTLAPGQMSGIVETPFGFHLILREPLTEVHCAHLMVTWKGADKAPPEVTRSKEEARARAEEARTQALAGKDWATLVRTYSDTPMREDGGDLGWFGPRQLAPQLDKVAFDLDIGAVSPLVESPRGWHVLKRLE
jgi:hypothetical protein